MESRATASGGMLGSGGIKQGRERTPGRGQQCGDCWGEGNLRGLKSNGKIQ